MRRLQILAALFLAFLVSFLAVRPTYAWIGKNFWEKISCPADIDCTVRAASTAGINFISKVAINKDFEEITEADLQKMVKGEWNQGLASAVGQVGGLAYSFPPIHVGDYIKSELADNLLARPAVAAPSTRGTMALSPVKDVWDRMRNIAYGLFVIVMVVTGVMIILQKEISPRVVITFTSALPKILMGLVLITFSFPLIALFIDVGAVFGTQLVLRVVGDLFLELEHRFREGVANTFSAIPAILIGYFATGLTGLQILELPALVLFAVFVAAAIILVGMTIFRVISAYAWLIVYTIFSPFLFLFGSLPGQEGAITNLFKNIAAKVLVFPVILFFALLGVWLAGTAYTEGAIQKTEGFLKGSLGELITGLLVTPSLGAILSLIVLAIAFKAPGIIEEALGVGGKKKK